MRWTSWWPHSRQRRLSVVGLDVSADACHWVVLTGSPEQPERVCCAEPLNLPEAWVLHGDVLQPQALGQWLRAALRAAGHRPEAMYLGLDDACVSHHTVTLVAGLSDADVAFQLQAEVQSRGASDAAEVCMDYRLDPQSGPAGEQRYRVQTVPRERVEMWQRVAAAAKLEAVLLEPRSDAALRARGRETFGTLPLAGKTTSKSCGPALGLALRAWHEGEFNFFPYRQKQQQVQRHAWVLGVAVCAMGGAFLAAGLTLVALSVAENKQPNPVEVARAARAQDEAKKNHALATAAQQHNAELTRWKQARQEWQAQSLQWSRVLSQAAQGVWVLSVKQQDTRWTLQGEALTSDHVQHLVQQLKALDIWAQAPELPHMDVVPALSTTGLPVWQFRIEANLKAGV